MSLKNPYRQAMRAVLLATVAMTGAGCVSDPHLEPSARAAAGKEGSATDALLRVARATRDNGDFASAVTVYKRVHDLAPGRVNVLIELGQVLSALGAHNEAADVFRKAIRSEPEKANAEALRGLGNNLLALNQPQLALEQFVAALAVGEDPRLYNGMGVVHDMNGSYESAQASYRSGLELAPSDVNLRNNLALSLALSGKFDEAIQTLGPVVKDSRASARHRQNLALIYGLAGRPSEAANVARIDFDEPTVQNNLAYYETLRAMSPKERAAVVFGITVLTAPATPASDATKAPAKAAAGKDAMGIVELPGSDE